MPMHSLVRHGPSNLLLPGSNIVAICVYEEFTVPNLIKHLRRSGVKHKTGEERAGRRGSHAADRKTNRSAEKMTFPRCFAIFFVQLDIPLLFACTEQQIRGKEDPVLDHALRVCKSQWTKSKFRKP